MKSIFNEETHKFGWLLNRWYEKCAYVFGIGWGIVFIIAFLVGFIRAL